MLPFVKQAGKQPTQFLNQGLRGLPARPALSVRPVRPSEAFRPAPAGASTSAPSNASQEELAVATSTVPLENSELVRWREFNNAEEDALYGPAAGEEADGAGEPVSAWLGLQALGVATLLVGSFAALGVYGAARWLGVSSPEEFARAMRGNLEDRMPGLVESVRAGPDAQTGPNVLGTNGDVDDSKLTQWLEWVEGKGKKPQD